MTFLSGGEFSLNKQIWPRCDCGPGLFVVNFCCNNEDVDDDDVKLNGDNDEFKFVDVEIEC
jgi:hypothetical protein